ncbi:hypothetical protein L195_g035436, partial [Trifolium pratense]
MEIQNLPPFNVTKMFNLPTLCGVSLPCHLNNVSVADALSESHGIKNLTVNSAQSPSESNSSSKPQHHSSPNSPSLMTVVEL